MIRVVLPAHLRTLAHVSGEVTLDLDGPVTVGSVLDALEARKQFRDASHDEPVSNGSEAIGHFTLTEPERPWWSRFIDFMGAA